MDDEYDPLIENDDGLASNRQIKLNLDLCSWEVGTCDEILNYRQGGLLNYLLLSIGSGFYRILQFWAEGSPSEFLIAWGICPVTISMSGLLNCLYS